MRATTVRFGTDLWEMLEREAKRSGVSVAQYVREAALTRIAYSAGQRGEEPFGTSRDSDPAEPLPELGGLPEGAEAVRRQGLQARRQSEHLMRESRRIADSRPRPRLSLRSAARAAPPSAGSRPPTRRTSPTAT